MTSKPRILIISPVSPYPPTDGGRLRTLKLCKVLLYKYDFTVIAKAGSEDLQIIKSAGEAIKDIRFVLIEKSESEAQNQAASGLLNKLKLKILEWCDFWQGMPHGARYDIDINMKHAIDRLIEQEHFDLINVEHLYMTQYVRDIQDISLVITEMDIEYEKFKGFVEYGHHNYSKQPLIRLIDKILIRAKRPFQLRFVKNFESSLKDTFSLCITVSDKDKMYLQSMNPQLDIAVVPNGVDTQYFKPFEIENKTPTLVFSGHMGYFPNEDAVLYFHKFIYPIVKKDIPNLQLHIVGKSPSDAIRSLADTFINVTGLVEDVRPYMANNFVYIVPLRVGSGTRLKILEAMGMQMAIVSTSKGCEGLGVEDGKNILIADDPNEFAGKVISLLKDPEKRIALGKNGRKLVEEKYDWQIIARIQDKVYQDALEKADRGRR